MRKNHPYYGKSTITNFPGSPRTMDFIAFSWTMRNWWGNPCVSHMLNYTIRWKSNGKSAPILWEKYEHQFPRISIQWILLHFPIPWEIYGETHAFPIWCHWLIFSYTTHPPSCILPSFFQNTSQLLLPRRLWKFESTISFWKCKRKVVFLVIYLFNYDWSKSIFFMLNYGIAFSWGFSCVQFLSNKLEFFVSCNKIKGYEAIM